MSGLVMLALLTWGSPYLLGIVLLIEAVISASDMTTILATKASTGTAPGIHGLIAALMIAAAIPLIIGAAWHAARSSDLALVRRCGAHAG